MRVLVTGSSGMIGTRLMERLLSSGIDAIGIDKKPNAWNSEIDRLTLKVDLLDVPAINNALAGKSIDIVIHLAAHARVYNLVQSPNLAKENIDMLFNVLELCRQRKIPRILFSSSREVYGNRSDKFSFEEDDVSVVLTESPYTASKLSGESLIASYSRCYGINYIILRFSNVFGMYDDSDRLVPKFLSACFRNAPLTIYGTEKRVDFTYLDDTVQGVILCIEKFDSVANQTFNIATGVSTSLKEVAQMLKEISKSDSEIVELPGRVGEIRLYEANIQRAANLLGYAPQIDIRNGLSAAEKWYRPLSESDMEHGAPPIRHVIFDLDGTLYPFDVPDFRKSHLGVELHKSHIRYVSQKSGKDFKESEEFLSELLSKQKASGKTVRQSLCEEFGAKREEILEMTWGQIDTAFLCQHSDGAKEIIRHLRGREITFGLVTKAPMAWADRSIRELGIDATFDYVYTADDFSKDKKSVFRKILLRTGLPHGSVLSVGDDLDGDIRPAEELGMQVFHVSSEGGGLMGLKRFLSGAQVTPHDCK